MTVLTWTDEQLAVTIWAVFTFVPLIVIEGWMRWNRLLDRIAAAGAAHALFVDADIPQDQPETESVSKMLTTLVCGLIVLGLLTIMVKAWRGSSDGSSD